MIKQPTLDAYRRKLEQYLKSDLEDAGREYAIMSLRYAGHVGSGMRIEREDIARKKLRQSMIYALDNCRSASGNPTINSEELLSTTKELMIDHINKLLPTLVRRIDPAFPDSIDVSGEIENLRKNLIAEMEGSFDSYEHGFYRPAPSMTSNTVHVGSGAVIGTMQLAGDGAQQHGTATINIGAIQKALEEFERALDADTEISAEDKGAIRAEIDTIRPQLRKQQPNPVILREVLKSLRSIAEASASGVLASLAVTLFGGV